MPITRRTFLSGTAVVAVAAVGAGVGAGPAYAAGTAAPSAPWAGAGAFQLAYNPSTAEQMQYINDHTFIQAADGTWHLFGILGNVPALGMTPNSTLEKSFAHATAPSLAGPWTRQATIVGTNPNGMLNPGDLHMWAPHVIEVDGVYHMFYAGGGDWSSTWGTMTINHSVSNDLYTWSQATVLFSGGRTRDPCVIRDDANARWIMYYCDVTGTASAQGSNIVAARTSTDLVTWSAAQTVFTDPATQGNSTTESPFVVNRNGYWYLFIGPRGGYVGTDVFASNDPLSFAPSDYTGHIPAHAVEVVNDGVQDWVSGAGEFELGISLAPLHWQSFAPPWQSRDNPVVALDHLGRLNLFALDPTDYSILQCVQTDPANDVWGNWTTFGPPAGAVPTLGANLDGRLEIFVLGVNGANLTHRVQAADGSWGAWQSFGGAAGAAPVVSHHADGRLSVFAVGPGGRYIAQCEQNVPNAAATAWTAWNADFGGPCGGPPAVGINADGRMEVFAIAPARNYIAHCWQHSANSGFGSWDATLGGACGGTPTVARDARGVLELHALAPAGAGVNLLPQTAPSSGWGSWTSAAVPNGWADAACTLVANQDGRLESFVLTPAGSVLSHRWQHNTTDGTWSDWAEFGSGPCQYSATPSAVLDAAGRIHVFAVYTDGSIWTSVQTGPNSGWGAWQAFGGTQKVAVLPTVSAT